MSEIGNINESTFSEMIYGAPAPAKTPIALNLHKAIFVPPKNPAPAHKIGLADPFQVNGDGQAKIIVLKSKIKPMEIGGGGELGLTYQWGGQEPPKGTFYVQGELNDGKGNYIQGEIKQDNNGKGNATLKAGHKQGK